MTTGSRDSIRAMSPRPHRQGAPPHPRRPSARQSVSLLHSARGQPSRLKQQINASSSASDSGLKRSDSGGESGSTNSPSSLQAVGGQHSSGESTNAEKWFEKSNNEVGENSAAFADNDPPFFLRNSSSSETPPDLRQQVTNITHDDGTNSLPLHTGLLNLGTDGSSTEDFRSVIDDLTIENKKLKRRLKKYEKLHDSHLKDEKLFEVRIHGLPAEKKRELEETLRKFASGLGSGGVNAFPPDGYTSLKPMLKGAKTASSQTSFQVADSAYASMSASGQGSSAQSASDINHKMTPSQYPAARRQNIHNYLHDIPEGLLPNQSPASMTERAKKKLIVRRMEQIFAGKGAAAAGHQQSIQQEEVSQSAAKTDRTALEASGQRASKEGTREANIMNCDTEDPLDRKRGQKRPYADSAANHHREDDKPAQQDLTEQRPTRPIDLDPQRAQVPAENIRYLRQMGFSPSYPDSSKSPREDHGWIFLNFLINMAQLHTIHVTSDFVRTALSEYSQKLQLSDDGRRVRWRGGKDITGTNSSGGGSSNEHNGEDTPEHQSPRKRPRLAPNESSQQIGGASQRWQQQPENSKYAYTPLFFHRDNSDEADASSSEEEDETESVSSQIPTAPLAGNSSGMTSSGIRTKIGVPLASTTRKQKKHEDGPIIFYNNARFCTDLSGDRKAHANHSPPAYTVASHAPIGAQRSESDEEDNERGALTQALELPEPMDLTDNPIPEHMEISFPESSPPRSQSFKEHAPINLEVTGIGGVWPADHFSISVESRHALVDRPHNTDVTADATSKSIPSRFTKLLRPSGSETSTRQIRKEIVASKVQRLPPSELPAALNYMPFEEGFEDDESDEGSYTESEVPESPGALPPSAAPQPVGITYASSEDEDDESDEEDEDDGEVDFLAGLRQVDPEAVRQKEREYDANMAERLAEDIPAGSSAATAGGGSGFASPTTAMNRDEYRRAVREARINSAKPSLTQASESKVVNHMKDASSDGESSDEDEVMSDTKS